MKVILIIAGWILTAGAFFIAYLFYNQYRIKPADLSSSMGILAEDPQIIKDEFNAANASMRLYLKDEEIPVAIPGLILQKADQRIYSLKKGDKIRFFEKKKPKRLALEKTRRIAMGLGDQYGDFYTKEEAVAHFRKPDKLIIATLFVIGGAMLIYFLIRAVRP